MLSFVLDVSRHHKDADWSQLTVKWCSEITYQLKKNRWQIFFTIGLSLAHCISCCWCTEEATASGWDHILSLLDCLRCGLTHKPAPQPMHLLLIQTSPHSEGLNFICATDRNIVSSQKKLHSLLLSSKLCNCKNNEGFQWVLQLSFCNEIQWKHGAQGFLPSLQNHRASWQYSYIYANPRTNSKRCERNSIFAWSVCAVCFFVLLLLLQGSSSAHHPFTLFSILRTTNILHSNSR